MTTILFDAFGDAQLTRGHDFVGLSIMYNGAEMHRVTEIHMDKNTRRFFIEWKVRLALDGIEYVHRGDLHGMRTHILVFGAEETDPNTGALIVRKPCVAVALEGPLFTFTTYEDAVKYEVSCLDEMRRKGVIFK